MFFFFLFLFHSELRRQTHIQGSLIYLFCFFFQQQPPFTVLLICLYIFFIIETSGESIKRSKKEINKDKFYKLLDAKKINTRIQVEQNTNKLNIKQKNHK